MSGRVVVRWSLRTWLQVLGRTLRGLCSTARCIISIYHGVFPGMTRRRHVPLDADQLAEQQGRGDDREVAVHQFAEVVEAATTSYKTWVVTPQVAYNKCLPVVMRICQRAEAARQRRTQREVQSKPAGTHEMDKVVFVLERNRAVRGLKLSMTEERLRHGPQHPPGTQRLWAAGSLEMVATVAAVVREVQQP